MYPLSHLTLSVHHDHDGDCRVTATVSSNSFAGSSSAWFQPSALAAFASAVLALAESGCGSATPEAGYLDPNGTNADPLVVIVGPRDSHGHFPVTVRLSAAAHIGADRYLITQRVEAGLDVVPAPLERFARVLSSIPTGSVVTAVLEGEGSF